MDDARCRLLRAPSARPPHALTLPRERELAPAMDDFRELVARPAHQARYARLRALGLNADSDLERSLGRRIVESTPGV